MALGRPPSDAEQAASLEYLKKIATQLDERQAWESFARILFRLSEFVYVR